MTELTTNQRKERLRLEKIVNDGKTVFMQVGFALKELRDQKLFVETHQNFAVYAEERFGLKKSRAYQLIEAVEVLSEVSTTVENNKLPTNERQFREVAKAPADKQVAVVEAAAAKAEAEDRKPTAKDYREAVAEVVYEDAIDDEPEPPKVDRWDMAVINAFRKCENRLGTLKQLASELSETEREILKEWLECVQH